MALIEPAGDADPSPRHETRDPGISVVVPTLNEEDALPKCLSLVRPQLLANDELIVVDGGSTDGTLKIAQSLCEQVIVAEGDSIGKARNIGADAATNPVVATLDADSLPPSGWVERVRTNFATNDELAVLWGTIEDRNGKPVRNLTGKFLTLIGGASGNNTAFRKSAFEASGGYEDVNFAEDFFIIHELAKHGPVRRDPALKMVMDMDRHRYQTVPMTAAGATGAVGGHLLGGTPGVVARGAGVGLAGCELFYEQVAQQKPSDGVLSNIHHDMVGLVLIPAGAALGGAGGLSLAGAGAGVALHHWLTEGVSFAPSALQRER